jgi:AraC-like DNA-binding protein
MFVEALRRHLERIPGSDRGWLAGLKDPAIGHVLALIHGRAAHAWTLEELGREAGLSRSLLAERFVSFVGQPPIQYLTQWRMQTAAGLLANGSLVRSVALEVGYDSEAAFSRAFKKSLGIPPAVWRERSREESNASQRVPAGRAARGRPARGGRGRPRLPRARSTR